MICRKLFKGDPTSTYTVFRFPCGDKSSVQGFQFHVLKFFPFSKRIFEGFELVYHATRFILKSFNRVYFDILWISLEQAAMELATMLFFTLVHFQKVWVNLEQAARFFLIRFDRVNFDKSYHIIYVMDQLRAVSKVYSDIFNRVYFHMLWISLEQAAMELATMLFLHWLIFIKFGLI